MLVLPAELHDKQGNLIPQGDPGTTRAQGPIFDQGQGDQEGYQGPQAGGQDQEGFYQVDTSGQNPFETESMIGQAAAISLRDTDQSGEAKTYFQT